MVHEAQWYIIVMIVSMVIVWSPEIVCVIYCVYAVYCIGLPIHDIFYIMFTDYP